MDEQEFQQLLAKARAGDRDARWTLVLRCHPVLVRAYWRYRKDMAAKGYMTIDAINDASIKIHEKFDQFRGTTQAEFHAWSGRIFRNCILQRLRRKRPETPPILPELPSRPAEPDDDDVLSAMARDLAYDRLDELDRVLLCLHLGEKKSLRAIREDILPVKCPELWKQHGSHLGSDYLLKQAVQGARENFERLAEIAFRELESEGE